MPGIEGSSELVQELRLFREALQANPPGATSRSYVIHKSSWGGIIVGLIAGVSVTACVGSAWYTSTVARTLQNEMRDVQAWQGVFSRDVSALKQALQHPEKKQ